jgi:dCTP deaminase
MGDQERGFWSTRDFKNRITHILPKEEAWDWLEGPQKARIEGSSIVLSLGKEAFISSKKKLTKLNEKDGYITIAPGDLALLITKEYIKIPADCMGFISIKTKHKLYGLINISGFHVDPGFQGMLKFSVYNAGTSDVVLKYSDPTFILFMTYIRKGAEEYGEKHEHWQQEHIKPEEMMPLLGAGIPLHEMAHRLGTVETAVKIYGGILVAILILLLTILFRPAGPAG